MSFLNTSPPPRASFFLLLEKALLCRRTFFLHVVGQFRLCSFEGLLVLVGVILVEKLRVFIYIYIYLAFAVSMRRSGKVARFQKLFTSSPRFFLL